MEWTDEGIVLSTKLHGENNVVLEVLTKEHGRHSGLVRGGRSKKNRPILQIGNQVSLIWKARLAEHLGFYTVELDKSPVGYLMDDRAALSGINSLCTLAHLLPERDPYPGLYKASLLITQYIENKEIWPLLLVRWEMELLNELGFGLDLSSCAATGTTDQLIYVSPKSGKAVSEAAGEPYKDKLLKLPNILSGYELQDSNPQQLKEAFTLTGYFLEKYILMPRDQHLPEVRKRMLDYLQIGSAN